MFIPNAGSVTTGVWQTWNALSPADGTWYSTTNIGIAPFNCDFQAAGCNASFAQIVAAYPNAKIKYGIGPNVGSGGTFVGNIDNFTIGISGSTTVYDFENLPNCTTNCFVNGTTGNNAATGLATDPVKTIQQGANLVSPGGTVNVAAGTYDESATIDHSMTLLGANANVRGDRGAAARRASSSESAPRPALISTSPLPLRSRSTGSGRSSTPVTRVPKRVACCCRWEPETS